MKMIHSVTHFRTALIAASAFIVTNLPAHAGLFSVLHEFGAPGDGRSPGDASASQDAGFILVSDGTIYGTTGQGGASNGGTVYRVNTDGTGYAIIHSFATGSPNAVVSTPLGGLARSGNTLYGTTRQGSLYNGSSVVFRVDTDGSNFGVVAQGGQQFSFPGGSFTKGAVISGDRLYLGAGYYRGVHTIQTDGQFAGAPFLQFPFGNSGDNAPSVTVVGDTMYVYSGNEIHRVDTNGSNDQLLATVQGGNSSHLTIDGEWIYGTSGYLSGSLQSGSVFKLKIDGTGFTELHAFDGLDGINPQQGLALVGDTLYGTTPDTLYSLKTNGTGFETLESVAGVGSELTALDGVLYGTTFNGGAYGQGTLFSYTLAAVPEPATAAWGMAALGGLALRRPRRAAKSTP